MIQKMCDGCGQPFLVKPSIAAQRHNCSWLCRYGGARSMRRGADHPNWKGGRSIDKQGYVLVFNREHPRSNSAGYVREHRLVMEGVLGRYLEASEDVHHINGVRHDNRPENLELWLVKQPRGVRPDAPHCATCRCFVEPAEYPCS